MRRVVVVEDNPHDRESVERGLRLDTSFRYVFHHFDRGDAAFDFLMQADTKVDLVILDWKLPDTTAPELLARLIADEMIPRQPVIVLTGSVESGSRPFLHKGVQDYFEKTLLATGLLPRIADNAIERHKLMQKLVQSERTALEAERVAEIANRSKSTFLANMSHELRTPMTAILGITELLLERTNDQEQINMLELIRNSGQHLAEIIGDILDLSKIEADTLKIESVEFNPFQLVEDLCKVMSYPAADKGLQIHCSCPCERQIIRADATRLRQILLNLIGNAIKFCDAGRIDVEMTLDSSMSPGLLHVTVTDCGAGIPIEAQESIFERFVQLDSGPRKRDGVGLGLSISRSLARLMGGDLTLTCPASKGCKFHLTMAAAVITPPASIAETSPRLTEPGMQFTNWRGRRLLIVEDTIANQFLLRRLLEPTGAVIECVSNGLEAVESITDNSTSAFAPDVVLMDMQMPIMNGFEAIAILRSKGVTVPIIAITAGASASDREKCLQIGCQGYLSKPFNKNALFEVIDQILRS